MQDAVLKIKELGAPPEGFTGDAAPGDEDFPSDETLDLWEAYEDAVVSITTPITWEEAEILIKCCPTDHMAGIEWSLLHCIESCIENEALETPQGVETYRALIGRCNSAMMREALSERLESYLAKRS